MSLQDAIARVRHADDELESAGPLPFPLPIGKLDRIVAGTVSALSADDWWVPGLRERVGAVLREVPVSDLVDGFAGSPDHRVAPPSASPALRALTAVGLAIGSDAPAVVHLGIGSIADGAFHEALNLAALTSARVVFVVAHLELDDGAPIGPQSAASADALADAYGIRTVVVDGTDAEAVQAAVRTAREHDGPTLVRANLP